MNGHLYGVLFKAANKSTVWYNVPAFKNAGITPPTTWTQLLADAKTLKASGVTPYSVGADVGWPITDLFENIYLRTAGPAMYHKLTNHQIPWTDPSVTTALKDMQQIFGNSSYIYGGNGGAATTDFPTSVTNVFTNPPKAAMVFEADFVESVITSSTKAAPTTGFDYFPFPSINGVGGNYVEAGGDIVTMFKSSPAAQRVRRLPGHGAGGRDLGSPGRLLFRQQERAGQRVHRPDRPPRGGGARERAGRRVRHVRPAAGGVRLDHRSGRMADLHQLPEEPEQHHGHREGAPVRPRPRPTRSEPGAHLRLE